jgi:hypothetical protein
MPRLYIAVGLLLTLCGSCGPAVQFEPYTVERPANLERVLGRNIVLVGPDTLALTVRFNPETKQNLLTNTAKGDTFRLVWATRYRGLYYLTAAHEARLCLKSAGA